MSEALAQQLFRAVAARLEADRQDALATVSLFLDSPVGVGDHPNVTDEIYTAISKLAAAEEALVTLQRNFVKPVEEAENKEDSPMNG